MEKENTPTFVQHTKSKQQSLMSRIKQLKMEGDELLDPNLSKTFYQAHGATVALQAGGDHRFSDFGEQLPMVIDMLRQLL